MDQRLKSLLERAESWPKDARDELVEAAAEIEGKLRKPKPQSKSNDDHELYMALMAAPKTGALLPPERGIRVRYRPPVKF